MPELPEVETTRRGIEPFLVDNVITKLDVHNSNLRWPVPAETSQLENSVVRSVDRRGKYLLIKVDAGTAIVHLGMSGSLRINEPTEPRRKHDHVEWFLRSGQVLRLHDPRRFGCVLWQAAHTPEHTLLASLGPEPLGNEFNDDYLFHATRRRNVAIKNLIMNSHVVVGVGNIYASESLFLAGIRPGKAAKRISKRDSTHLCESIKSTLERSIHQGGTTLRDFVNSDGNPGYFKQSLYVYDREGQPCKQCRSVIKQKTLGQRSTYYCPTCQS
ncbi:MAG: bifunctional DNA-formamidopyrimidine glycosylase/DNA-(apurinic or apyrimidinic site) lyase [Gammaproteobacteria bacterium]|nr:bifunctional DNA-formamidopyrimidine glycosylase/DNA-(apurinic or apyrimidinic site) lyase [Gammaproteobacteria bacterium]